MFKLALAQMAHPADGAVVPAVSRWAHDAARAGAQLLVFPECLMTPFEKTPADFAASAQPLEGEFVCHLQAIARETGLWIVFTLNEQNPEGGQPFNTAVVVDNDGAVRGRYRKTHLYAAHGIDEHQKMSVGNALLVPIETPFCTLGVGICYDLRFPEVARAAALAGCNVMVYPAAWVAGPHKKEHWSTLLCARAIENELFVAGCCRPDKQCIGTSRVVNPLGETIAAAGADEQLVIADISLAEIASARANMPCLEHRRPSLYGSLVAPKHDAPGLDAPESGVSELNAPASRH